MSNMRNPKKVSRGIIVPRELDKIILKKFGHIEDNGQKNPAYIRALREATEGYELDERDYLELAREVREAAEKLEKGKAAHFAKLRAGYDANRANVIKSKKRK